MRPAGAGEHSRPERLERLQALTDAALVHLDLEELLSALLERTTELLETDTCAILLLDEERSELVARAAIGIEEEVERGVRIPLGRGFAGRVAAERRPVILDDVDQADVVKPILRETGIKSLCCCWTRTRRSSSRVQLSGSRRRSSKPSASPSAAGSPAAWPQSAGP